MLEKEFVPYEQALILKELGFDEPYLGAYYHATKEFTVCDYKVHHARGEHTVLAPTFSQAFRWFRDKHNLKDKYGVFPHHTIMFNYIIGGGKEEEAELACLIKLIEIAKENKQ